MAPASDGEPAAALAMIFAADPDADWSEGFGHGMGDAEDDWRPKWLAGAAVNYMVLYLDGPTSADGPASHSFGMTLPKGYHLLEVRENTAEEEDARASCEEEGAVRAIARYNEMFGTDYPDAFDLSDEDYEAYSQLERIENRACGSKLNMKVVPSGLEHPVRLHIGRDLEFPDWT